MGEGVVADLVSFVEDPLGNAWKFLDLGADLEERRLHPVLLQHVEDLRRPLGIGPVVERDRDFLFLRAAVHVDHVGHRQVLENLVADQVGLGIDYDLALTGCRPRLDADDFARAFIVDVLSRRNGSQLLRRCGFVAGPTPPTVSGLPIPAATARMY